MIVPMICKNVNLQPQQAISGDAGFDLKANEETIIDIGETVVISTGVTLELPEGTVGLLCSKSGLAMRNGIIVLNAPGIIDSGYRGEVKAILKNLGTQKYKVKLYSKVAQLVILRYIDAMFQVQNDLSLTDRGDNGFGSTGV